MAVESSPFRGVRLTGRDAIAFRKQIRSDRVTNVAANNALANGRILLKDLHSNGIVTLKVSK